jgi:hypothetical protein
MQVSRQCRNATLVEVWQRRRIPCGADAAELMRREIDGPLLARLQIKGPLVGTGPGVGAQKVAARRKARRFCAS